MSDSSLDFATAFRIGPIYVSWYGIFIALGFLFFMLFSYIEWRKKGYDNFDFYILFFVGSIVALLGARVWYLIFNPSDIQGVVSFFSISSGRSILGSIFFGTIWVYYYTNKHASYIESRYAFSIIIPNILLGQAIGRWGNFFQQDVYGNVMQNPSFLPQFIQNGMYIQDETGEWAYRQPLFLYESILDLFGWMLITYWAKNSKKIKPGVHGGMYFLWYGSVRASLELFRDEEFIMRIGKIPTSFILAIMFAIVGLIFMVYYQFYYVKFTTWKHFYLKFKKQKFQNNFRIFLLLITFRTSIKSYKIDRNHNKLKYVDNCKTVKRRKINLYIQKIKTDY